MDLDEMKKMWVENEKALKENRILNERLLSTILKDKSNNVLNKMLMSEWANIITSASLLIIFLAMWRRVESGALMFSYVSSLIFITILLAFSWYKVQLLGRIDPGGQVVTEASRKIEQFRLIIAKERIVGIIILPFVLFVILAVVVYWVKHDNIFDKLSDYAWHIVLAIAGATIGSLIVYQKIYFNGIKHIKQNLEEIEAFRRGE